MVRWSRRLTILAGPAGVVVLTLAAVITSLAYVGSSGGRYSLLNHFISELGHTAESEASAVMNIGMLVGGILFGLFMVGVALHLRGILRGVMLIGGVLVGASGGLVGIFPMNVDLASHAVVAIGFFGGALLLLAIFSLATALARQPTYPRWMSALCLPAIVCSAVFLYLLVSTGAQALVAPVGERDPFLLITLAEWGALIGVLFWVMAIAIWRARQPE